MLPGGERPVRTPIRSPPDSPRVMTASYNYWLVTLSLAIAICASHTALDLAGRTAAARGRTWFEYGARHLVDALHRHARVGHRLHNPLRSADARQRAHPSHLPSPSLG